MKIKANELLEKIELLKSIVNETDFTGLSNKFYFKNSKIITFDGKMFIETEFKNEINILDFNHYNKIFTCTSDIQVELPDDIKNNIEISEIFTDSIKIQKKIEFIFKKDKIICKSSTESGLVETSIDFKSKLELSFFIHPLFILEVLKLCKTMEIKDDIVLFRNNNFYYFFRIRK